MKRIVSILCALTVLVTVFSHPAEAATGMQGYAAYRDGVTTSGFGNFEWHAAIMDKASSEDIYPVIHARGYGYNVQYGHWYEFMAGLPDYPYSNNNFIGYYRPKQVMSNTQRDQVTAKARSLAADFVAYTVVELMDYPVDNNPSGKTTVAVNDISAMRCDGLVEYCYEFNNLRIFGSDSYWDISRWGVNYKNQHKGTSITPKKQAEDYMYTVSMQP